MEFWMGLVALSLVALLAGLLLDRFSLRIIIYLSLFFIWFIASFRYMIGADFESYMNMYYYYSSHISSFTDILEGANEPTFLMLVAIFSEMGFSYQIIFIFYESIILVFFYRGLCYYVTDLKCRLIIIVAYALLQGGFWTSLNNIRSFAALSIFFGTSKYIFENNIIKYLCGCILAINFHYSIILWVWVYFVKYIKKLPSTVTFLGLMIISVVAGIKTVAISVMSFFLGLISFYGMKYGLILDAQAGGWLFVTDMVPFVLMTLLGITILRDSKDERIIFLGNVSVIFCIFVIITSIKFSGVAITDVFMRTGRSFFLFYLTFMGVSLYNMRIYLKNYFVYFIMFVYVLFAAKFFVIIYKSSAENNIERAAEQEISHGNIDYEFNFKIFD